MAALETDFCCPNKTLSHRQLKSHDLRDPENVPLRAVSAKSAFLRNGSEYFATLERALRRARRTIWIVGWDFNPDTLLRPKDSRETLGDLLRSLAQTCPDLEIRILVWAFGPIYSQKSVRLLFGKKCLQHPRISLRFDVQYAVRGCHHQKLVCIDDDIAFVGGIDLTSRRWDSSKHWAHDDTRRDPEGEPYDPIHDVQAMVSGEAAKLIGDVARRRWARATGEVHKPLENCQIHSLGGSGPSLIDCPVSLALTEPATRRHKGLDHGVAMTRQVILEAKRRLYIETQYLASFSIGQVLARRLSEKDGPEIVIVVTSSSHGMIEKFVMGGNRDRLIRRLKHADRHNRLRIYHPVVPSGQGEQEVLVHAKLLLADDCLVRIGSSNLNHRSEGLDTECDILFRACRSDHRGVIGAFLESLLAEYLGCDTGSVGQSLAQTGSLIQTIESLNKGPRGLREFVPDLSGATRPILGTMLFDPLVQGSR